MKIDEVMLGDIVSVSGSPIHVTLAVLNNWSDSIEPITLTPEILEKNGFENQGYAILELEDDCILSYYFHEYRLTKYYKDNILFRCECVYFHQLQHALKLCGINKEIVV